MNSSIKLFGTDGIRGTANKYPIIPEVAMKIGIAAGYKFKNGQHTHRVVIGKDTRLSGYMIENALTSGFLSAGIDVVLIGPAPTPAVSFLTRSLRADLGVMISASHNLYQDNGIKLFDRNGKKLSDEEEHDIENLMTQDLSKFYVKSEKIGRARRLDDAVGRYVEFVKSTFPKGETLEGFKIVIDTANGASYKIAPEIFWELGAEVIAINNEPDGTNINKNCGTNFPESLSRAVIEKGACVGLALDGDADRLIVVDEAGTIIDGDQIIAAIAGYWQGSNILSSNNVVSTIMSNFGLENYLNSININLIRARVGDRYVAEGMREYKANLGGEQSGHVILGDYSTTGDGLIAALQILAILKEKKKLPASKVLKVFEPIPQILRNVRYNRNISKTDSAEIDRIIKDAEEQISSFGRIVIRKSGTEPLIRIMIEGKELQKITNLADDLEKRINRIIN